MNELKYQSTLPFGDKPSNVQFACNDKYIAVPQDNYSIIVNRLINDIDLHTVSLNLVLHSGHYSPISALVFTQDGDQQLLCSCSKDYIILWDINSAEHCHETGEQIQGQIIAESLGTVQYCSFSPCGQQLAVCVDCLVYVLSHQSLELIATLEGHNATVTSAQYCPHYTATVVSVSVDRTFKIWDVEACVLVYQSTILSASPLISLSMDHAKPQFSMGTADGQVWVHDLLNDSGFQCVHSIDMSKILSSLTSQNTTMPQHKGPACVSSRPSWQQTPDSLQGDTTQDTVERGCSVLAMCFSSPLLTSRGHTISGGHPQLSSHLTEALTQTSYLFIATTDSLVRLNANTLDVCSHVNFADVEITSLSPTTLSAASSIHLHPTHNNRVWCMVGRLFDDKVDVLHWDYPGESGEVTQALQQLTLHSPPSTNQLSVLSSDPLQDSSPLRAVLIPKKKSNTPKKGVNKSTKKGNVVRDQPLTFTATIKSSGYTSTPKRTMFQPNTGKATQTKRKVDKQSNMDIVSLMSGDSIYPLTSPHPSLLLTKLSVSDQPHGISCISVSDNGHSVCCAVYNCTAQIYKLPLTHKSTTYTGHKGSVDWVRWSHDSHKIITSSNDNTACVWVKGQSEPALCIDKTLGNITAASNTTPQDNRAFRNGVKFAQFYYIDQFIFVVNERSLHLYKYNIEEGVKEDIKRYVNKSHYKSVTQLDLPAKQVTAFCAINSFHSYIVLAAGSDRSLSVYDMNKGAVVRQTHDVHTRPCHALSMNEGSMTMSHPSTSYDLYVTAAVTDGIKLWDLRTDRCVQKYEGHLNRSHSCGLSLSACGRFLATGAEDKSAYVYDVRGGMYLEKLTGHTDVVSAVQFHPNSPHLLTASLDGVLREYGPVK